MTAHGLSSIEPMAADMARRVKMSTMTTATHTRVCARLLLLREGLGGRLG
jgi:hypothetical protein